MQEREEISDGEGSYMINKLAAMSQAIRQRREELAATNKTYYKQGAVAARAGLDQRTLSTIETGNIGEMPKPHILNPIARELSNSTEEAQQLLAQWLALAGYSIAHDAPTTLAEDELAHRIALDKYLLYNYHPRDVKGLAIAVKGAIDGYLEVEGSKAGVSKEAGEGSLRGDMIQPDNNYPTHRTQQQPYADDTSGVEITDYPGLASPPPLEVPPLSGILKQDEACLEPSVRITHGSGSRRVTTWAIVGLLLPLLAIALLLIVIPFKIWAYLPFMGLLLVWVCGFLLIAGLIIGIITLTMYRHSSRPRIVLNAGVANLIITLTVLVIIFLPVQGWGT